MKTKKILLVEHDDQGAKFDRPVLLVDDRLIRGEPHPNGVVFVVPCDTSEQEDA